ncbi:hypothetical protein [Mangrovimonas xylaniphaga]|uniref:hypothetical protein n=1 Tax=Mangrovimonas xylaniphaga TaxID=1645915 RepID=UPI0006B57EBA|nr:hypothetical protein [Mangrovimonas xylaniphaga]
MTKLVLSEHLKEELNGRKIKAAVFHTFNFDSEFFENYLLPLFLPEIPFGDNKIQNTILWKKFQHDLPPITVYCDFHAKAQRGIHLNYIVRPIDIPKKNGVKPCYHPKHSYVLLEDDELLLYTGSNNLTEAGWCSNLEGVNFFKLKSGTNFPRQFKDQFKEFNRNIRKTFFNEGFQDEHTESKADNLIDRFFRSQGYTSDIDNICFDTFSRSELNLEDFPSLLKHLKVELNNDEPFEQVEVISPYFPKSIKLFEQLKTITQCNDISFSIPFENTNVVALNRDLFDMVLDKGMKWKTIKALQNTKGYRFNHSKIYQFVGRDKVFQVVGSINFTNMAWKGAREGGNYESVVVYSSKKEDYRSLLESYDCTSLTFVGQNEEEGVSESREDVFALSFIIDWSSGVLSISNLNEAEQHGKIEFDELPAILINTSRDVKLSEDHIRYFTNTPIIKVRPSNKSIFFYYYPIHKNIESKPLPEYLNLSDSELLELWQELDSSEDTSGVLRIIDKFIDRVTDETGDLDEGAIKETQSTLNLMATHLSGLLSLQKKIFAKGRTERENKAILKLRDYYLFANNVDTLLGYRNLLVKMSNGDKLNNGFYWLLLNCINIFFFKDLNEGDFENPEDFDKVSLIKKGLKKEIKALKLRIVNGRLTEKHLEWTLKMLKDDIK